MGDDIPGRGNSVCRDIGSWILIIYSSGFKKYRSWIMSIAWDLVKHSIIVFSRITNHSGLPRVILVLTLENLPPGNPPCQEQAGTVSYLRLTILGLLSQELDEGLNNLCFYIPYSLLVVLVLGKLENHWVRELLGVWHGSMMGVWDEGWTWRVGTD